jgi:hypothetical protein
LLCTVCGCGCGCGCAVVIYFCHIVILYFVLFSGG